MSEYPNWNVQEHFYTYGWDDYVISADGMLSLDGLRVGKGSGNLVGVEQEKVEQWYTDGWNAAMQAEQEQGRAIFLCNELLKRMHGGDEWYGTDFDQPKAIVNKIVKSVKQEI